MIVSLIILFNFISYKFIYYSIINPINLNFFNIINSFKLDVLTPIFFIENLLIQFFIIYIIYLLSVNNNLYYILLYTFLEIVLFGVFICLYQMELFTGFLWVAEFTIVFIAVILLFYLNVDGLHIKYTVNTSNLFYFIPTLFIFCLYFNFDIYSESELYLPLELNYIDLFDNYYESINNYLMNDFTALTLSYYILNSIEFISIGFLLLIGSVVCVNLYKSNKNYSIIKQANVLNIFDFFKDFINFTFIRKQDLNKQTLKTSSLRSIKKLINWYKKKLI